MSDATKPELVNRWFQFDPSKPRPKFVQLAIEGSPEFERILRKMRQLACKRPERN